MTDFEIYDFDETPDAGVDAVILNRMTSTLMILQCKQYTQDRAAMITALEALLDKCPQDVKVVVIEKPPGTGSVRQFLAALSRTSIGAPETYAARANANARRVADILDRATEPSSKP